MTWDKEKVKEVNKCPHRIGRFKDVKGFWFFTRRMFECAKCGELLTKKEYKSIKIPVPLIHRGKC